MAARDLDRTWGRPAREGTHSGELPLRSQEEEELAIEHLKEKHKCKGITVLKS